MILGQEHICAALFTALKTFAGGEIVPCEQDDVLRVPASEELLLLVHTCRLREGAHRYCDALRVTNSSDLRIQNTYVTARQWQQVNCNLGNLLRSVNFECVSLFGLFRGGVVPMTWRGHVTSESCGFRNFNDNTLSPRG